MLVNEIDAIPFLKSGSKVEMSYRTLSNGGLQLTTEPFFKSLLVAMHRNHIHELLSRGRILLPPEEARLMMGVMDEEGILKPGQVSFFLKIIYLFSKFKIAG
jgi:RNA-dependent RNA polymerase